uniref:30S ribosomal protein S13 n=1 Tax=Spongospora subterranea TaxID=70186 RepID=A0A096XTV1_9EUKA|nr:30S ribosomal protein S13 [Spongospora subterranea]AIK19913.1 30S ribosomal protein S13 [Spongospora subterranea]
MLKNSVQLFNIQLDLTKNLIISLIQIFGINISLSLFLCKKFGFNKNSRLNEVSTSTLAELKKFILTNYAIQLKLKKITQSSIQELSSIKSIPGLRHKLKLPVRGQRTRTNHKTQKKYKLKIHAF